MNIQIPFIFNQSNLLKSVLLVTGLTLSAAAQAIVNPVNDCTDNVNNIGCTYPNIVSLSGFRADGTPFIRCTGSLIKKSSNSLVFLTAAHCTAAWQNQMYADANFKVGVSFDAKIYRPDPNSTAGADTTQYLVGGQPVTNSHFLSSPGQTNHAWNIPNDYGIVVLNASPNGYVTAGGKDLNAYINTINPVELIQGVDTLKGILVANTTKMTHVGYGIGWNQTGAKGGGNKGGVGPDVTGFLIRSVANNSTFTNYGGALQDWIMGSQNVNKDESGSCGGDSGGPSFTSVAGKQLQVGIISSGASNCALTFIDQRIDVPKAQSFVNCALNSNDPISCGCGTLIDNKGRCTQ